MTNTRSFALPLPAGFLGERSEKGWVAVRESETAALREAGFFEAARMDAMGEPTTLGGRGSLRRVRLPSGSALLRPYLHGGLLRFLTGARFLDPARPFRELEISEAFRSSGLATPQALGAAAFHAGVGFRLYFLSRETPGMDLFEFLAKEDGQKRRQLVLESVGVSLRRMHDAGWFHADLHPKNLLVPVSGDEIFFLDLDRSRQAGNSLSSSERLKNFVRLFRFGERRRALGQSGAWSREEFAMLLHGYAGQESPSLLDRVESEFRRSVWRHRLGWSLERAFGAGR